MAPLDRSSSRRERLGFEMKKHHCRSQFGPTPKGVSPNQLSYHYQGSSAVITSDLLLSLFLCEQPVHEGGSFAGRAGDTAIFDVEVVEHHDP